MVIYDMSSQDFTAQEIRDLRFVYGVFDPSNKGYVEIEDVRKALKILGFKVSRSSVQQLVRDVVTGGKLSTRGQIKFDDFLQMISKLQGTSYDKYGEISQAFEFLDTNQDGMISLEDLKALNLSLKLGLSDSDLKGMIEVADKDGDGVVSASELIQVLMKTHLFK